jgi:hypothetical protein
MYVVSLVPSPSLPAATVSKVERLRHPNSRRSQAVGYPRSPVTPYALPVLCLSPVLLKKKIDAGPKEYIHDPNFADPISGGVVEVFRSVVDFHAGLAQIFR